MSSLGSDLIVAVAAVGAALLGFAGLVKITAPEAAASALEQLRLPPAEPLVRVVGAAEVAVAAGWFASPSRLSAVGLTTMYVVFIAAGAAFMRARGAAASCGCLGSAGARFTTTHLAYNAVTAAAAAATAVWHPSRGIAPGGALAALAFTTGLAVATYLSYLLLTEFDDAVRAFRGTPGADPRDLSVVRVEPRP